MSAKPMRLLCLILVIVASVVTAVIFARTGWSRSDRSAAATIPTSPSPAVGSIAGSFDVNLSGSATYTIPIRVAPGTSGIEPSLSLVYDSQALSGPLGSGWAIGGLSAITRGPKNARFDGVPEGVTLQDSDALYLDGQRLVAINTTGAGASRTIEYRKATDDQTRVIERGADFGSATFMVNTKGGLTIEFDSVPGSPSDQNRGDIRFSNNSVLLRAESRVTDSTGNYMDFYYLVNGSGNYDIKTIRYTGHVGQPSGASEDHPPYALVDFAYENAPRNAKSYIAGQSLIVDKRLVSITASIATLPDDLDSTSWQQVSRYAFDYEDRENANRFVLKGIHQYGEDDSQLTPTQFSYSTPAIGWGDASYTFPAILAAHTELAAGYRFAHISTSAKPLPDLLYATQIEGQLEAFSFRNNGTSWSSLDQFKPPVPFNDGNGKDLGVIVADITGDGRADLLQANHMAGQPTVTSSYVAGATGWDRRSDFDLPFTVSQDGVRVANYRLENWTGGPGRDLLYQSGGQKGFLVNTSTGWKSDPRYSPPVELGDRTWTVDVDCSGKPSLVSAVKDASGAYSWKIYKFGPQGWDEVTSSDFKFPFSANTNPEAIRIISVDGSTCAGLLVATAEGNGLHEVYQASATGWKSLVAKRPPFDLVDAKGQASKASVAFVRGDVYSDVIANRVLADGSTVKYLYYQTSSGWEPAAPSFSIPTLGRAADKVPANLYIADFTDDGKADIVIPANSRQSFGQLFAAQDSGFIETPDFAPPVAFARKDHQDQGVRMVDLNGDGLADLLVSKSGGGSSAAWINTGAGWHNEPGLSPPVVFAGDDISGSPVQFVDVDGDGFVDLLSSYKDKNGATTTKYFRNVAAADGTRKWSDVATDGSSLSGLIPPSAYPFASDKIGDMGVRFADLTGTGRPYMLVGFQPPGPGAVKVLKAFKNDGTKWIEAPEYAPPVPFVAQIASASDPSRDLSVQITDVNADGLPDIVASYHDPNDAGNPVKGVWLSTGTGWAKSSINVPVALDTLTLDPQQGLQWEKNASVQWADLNGDGLPDIVYTRREGDTNESTTYLGTGQGWAADPNWQIPKDALADRGGDPGLRIIDVNGDGYADLLYIRQDSDASIKKGLYVNNGLGWLPKDNTPVPGIPFVDKDGNDLGVRLVDLEGRGLLDLIQAYSADSQQASIKLNQSHRSDVIQMIDAGYGVKTSVYYQSLLEPVTTDVGASQLNLRSEFAWQRVYAPVHDPVSYPIVAPIPATYVVRRAIVAEAPTRQTAFSYQYGGYRADALSKMGLGFAWRDSIDEAKAVLTHVDLSQNINYAGRPVHEESCWMNFSNLPPAPALETGTCSKAGKPGFTWVKRLNATDSSWEVKEGQVGGGSLPSRTLRQVSLTASQSITYELDGNGIESRKDEFQYDKPASGSLIERHLNLITSKTSFGDGSAIQTDNKYDDDVQHWHLGRLVSTTITKTPAPPKPGQDPKTPEIRAAGFSYDSRSGLLTSETINLGTTREVTTTYKRDSHGNIIEKQINAPEIAQSDPTLYKYDAVHRFLISTTNTLKHRTTQVLCLTTGLTCETTDANNVTTSYEYDGFGRLLHLRAPTGTDIDGNDTSIEASTEYLELKALDSSVPTAGVDAAFATRISATDQKSPLPYAYKLLDSQGRTLRTVTDAFTKDATKHRYLIHDTVYDLFGQVARVSLPYEVGKSPDWVVLTRDVLGRVTQQVSADKGVVQTSYRGQKTGGMVTTVLDKRFQIPTKAITITNMRRELIATIDPGGSKVSYEYDAGGRPTKITDALGKVTRYSYDNFGNRKAVSDPDSGTWNYEFDALGRLITQIDGNAGQQVVTRIEYDDLGRITREIKPTEAFTWSYDGQHGIGNVASVKDDAGKYNKQISYDQVGRVDDVSVTIDNATYRTAQTYDSYGRIAKVSYPEGLTINNIFDAKGVLVKVSNATTQQAYWSLDATDVFGHITASSYANGVKQSNSFDATTGRPAQLKAIAPSNNLIVDLKLHYDVAGDLRRREETVQKKSETFSYDKLDRLVGLSRPDGSSETYSYDAGGRIKSKAGLKYVYADAGAVNSTGCGKTLAHHAVIMTVAQQGQHPYSYDCHGNMTSSAGVTYTYSSDGKLTKAQQDPSSIKKAQSVAFDYGPNGERYRERATHGLRQLETLTVGSYQKITEYGSDLFGTPPQLTLVRQRWYLNNGYGTFAVVEKSRQYSNELVAPVDADKVWYLHKDQVGSVLAITDEHANVRAQYWYDPWGARSGSVMDPPSAPSGEQLGDSWSDGYIGQEHLPDFGLIHLNGRVYDPQLGVFTSPDPFNTAPSNSQFYNPYSYTINNPLRHADPSGYCFLGCFWQAPGRVLGGILGGIANGIGHIVSTVANAFADAGKWVAQNWRQIVVVAAVVVVTVATVGTGGPAAASLGTAILSGMAAGATAGALTAALYGGSVDDILMGALKGGAIGAVSGAAFYGVGSLTAGGGTLADIGGVAGHGVIGGARELAYGGNFWQGFEAGAFTKTSSLVVPNFDSGVLNTTRAAIVGGAAAAIGGGNFANGAFTGAFSYTFNDYLHQPPRQDAIEQDYSPELTAVAAVGAVYSAIVGIGVAAEAGLDYLFGEGLLSAPEPAFGVWEAYESETRVSQATELISDWLGEGAKPVLDTESDLMLRSADGTRSIRFDLINSHGEVPHVNVQTWESTYPGSPRMTNTFNRHINFPTYPRP